MQKLQIQDQKPACDKKFELYDDLYFINTIFAT